MFGQQKSRRCPCTRHDWCGDTDGCRRDQQAWLENRSAQADNLRSMRRAAALIRANVVIEFGAGMSGFAVGGHATRADECLP